MAADVAQWKCSNIKYYTSAFSNILIDLGRGWFHWDRSNQWLIKLQNMIPGDNLLGIL